MRNRTSFIRQLLGSLFVWVAFVVVSSPALAEEAKAWRSWQIDNPAWAGLLAAATLGAWPSRFANDVKAVPVFQVEAIADGALEFSKTHAEKAFRLWRGIGFAAEAAIVLGIIAWRSRRQRRSVALPSSPAA